MKFIGTAAASVLLLMCPACGGSGAPSSGDTGTPDISAKSSASLETGGDGQTDKGPKNTENSAASEQKPAASDGSKGSAVQAPAASDASGQKSEASASVSKPGQGVEAMEIVAKGESPWSLKASNIKYDDASKRSTASNVTWKLLDKNTGKSLLELRGDAAVINVATQGLFFEGPVTAKGANGESITCTKLVWDGQKRQLHGSNGVKVVREDSVMTGREMIASPDLKKVEINGDVRVYFTSDLSLKGSTD